MSPDLRQANLDQLWATLRPMKDEYGAIANALEPSALDHNEFLVWVAVMTVYAELVERESSEDADHPALKPTGLRLPRCLQVIRCRAFGCPERQHDHASESLAKSCWRCGRDYDGR